MKENAVEEKPVKRGTRIFSKFLTVIIIFLVLICLILFFKIVTDSEVSVFGVKFYYVVTESMYPTIKPNSLIVVKSVDPDTLEVGDIISFTSRDESIYGLINTHRIFSIEEENGKRVFITKGDYNPAPDSSYVYEEDIKGKVILHTPPMKVLTDLLTFAGTTTGFMVVIIMPLVLILAMVMRSFFKNLKASIKVAEEEEAAEVAEKEEERRKAARQILEIYFGKPLNEITEADIEEKLKDLE